MIYKRGKCKLDSAGRCAKCGKRGSCGKYWYRFMWQGTLVRESTKQGSDKVARQMESAHRTSLAKGEVGIREKKIVPSLADFVKGRFEPWANPQRPRRIVKPQEATQEGFRASRQRGGEERPETHSPVRAVQPASHVPDSSG